MSIRTFEEAKEHLGHKIVCVGYALKDKKGTPDYYNISVECETCNIVLIDFERTENENI